MQKDVNIKVDFGGGLDLVFGGKMQVTVTLPAPATIAMAISQLQVHYATTKKDMFAQNAQLRAGILVLVNDADWELAEKQQTVLEEGDKLSFISTLHGG